MCNLRPLNDNLIEYTGLQYGRLCSNTKAVSVFVICLQCLFPPLWRLKHYCIQGPTHPISILVLCASVSRINSSRLKAAMISRSCPCQWITLHLNTEVSTVVKSRTHQIISGSKWDFMSRAETRTNVSEKRCTLLWIVTWNDVSFWWRRQLITAGSAVSQLWQLHRILHEFMSARSLH